MTEYIEREAVYNFCKEQLEKETGAYSKGRNVGLHVAMSAAMNKDAIPAADVRPVVLCKDCKYNNACLTQSFVEDASIIPFDRNTFFCADGWRKANV